MGRNSLPKAYKKVIESHDLGSTSQSISRSHDSTRQTSTSNNQHQCWRSASRMRHKNSTEFLWLLVWNCQNLLQYYLNCLRLKFYEWWTRQINNLVLDILQQVNSTYITFTTLHSTLFPFLAEDLRLWSLYSKSKVKSNSHIFSEMWTTTWSTTVDQLVFSNQSHRWLTWLAWLSSCTYSIT